MLSPSPLKLARIARGLTQAELAQRVRTYQQRISRVERGSRLTQYEIEALAVVLGTPADVLFPASREERRIECFVGNRK